MKLPTIILASASPRRRELLSQAGFSFTVLPSQLEEVITSTVPEEIVQELSFQKAQDIANKQSVPTLVIGADTIVALNGTIMGKPKNKNHAFEMLQLLQGQTHQVYTGVTLFLQQATPRNFTFLNVLKLRCIQWVQKKFFHILRKKKKRTSQILLLKLLINGKTKPAVMEYKLHLALNISKKLMEITIMLSVFLLQDFIKK